MKYSQWIGILAALGLGIVCYFPWTWYPDLNTYFTGFYSHENMYGKPYKAFWALGGLAILFFAINRVWAKRVNLLICAFLVAYAVRIFFVYTACYKGICPEKQFGIWVVIFAPITMLVMAFLPKMNPPQKNSNP
jgi:hypothetical protein